MADGRAVWGIDIGQAGLKALKLEHAESAGQVVATAFDYVPHPKILSQPDAVPEELIPQALDKFFSRNQVQGDKVAISVPGQSALARFIQLPPVESSKIAEIVKYEARQQIPFALEDVIWDYQTLGGGTEESGYLLDAEVGLFAMKREQVMHHLRPFLDRKIEVELVQIAPLALYNFLTYDQFGLTPEESAGGLDEYTILLDMGADNTTLLVSNGEKIWIRNVPIGGNHFTRALTKEMKLTFAKAEHLKCNATKSPDPRAVFQALRPVFNDYVSEIQRSIGYFSSVNRDAKITRMLGLGNGFKLAGLQKFLQQNLQYEVQRVDSFQALVGDSVLHAPLFEENILSFGVPYGLALQTLGLSRIRTSLLPGEIVTARKIRKKKPWAVAAAASLLIGFAVSATGYTAVFNSVSEPTFKDANAKADTYKGKVNKNTSEYKTAETKFKTLSASASQLVKPLESRDYWLEVYKAINESLPRDIGDKQRDEQDITKRNRIKLSSITAVYQKDLGEWFKSLGENQFDLMLPEDKGIAPQGEGYVFTLSGESYFHDPDKHGDVDGVDVGYVIATLLKNLKSWEVEHKDDAPPFPVRKLGISHPTIIYSESGEFPYDPSGASRGVGLRRFRDADSNDDPRENRDRRRAVFGKKTDLKIAAESDGLLKGPKEEVASPTARMIRGTTFQLQFVWRKTPLDARLEEQPIADASTFKPPPIGDGQDEFDPDAGPPRSKQ